jgi:shikimate 5-dehydrogenase
MIDVSNFGGALLSPSLHENLTILDSRTPESKSTGIVDTIAQRRGSLVGYNCLALGIKSSLLRSNLASAYLNQPSLVVASSYSDAASLMYVLMSLQCKVIYVLGFKLPITVPASIKRITKQFQKSAFDKGYAPPIGVFSALPTDKADLLPPLIRMVGQMATATKKPRIFLDLANSSLRGGPAETARAAGWKTIMATDIIASTTVERLRILADQSVPYDFLKMVWKRGLY